jgi:hypothetical protein
MHAKDKSARKNECLSSLDGRAIKQYKSLIATNDKGANAIAFLRARWRNMMRNIFAVGHG